MTKKDQQVYTAVLAVLIIVAGVWFFMTRSPKTSEQKPSSENQQQTGQTQTPAETQTQNWDTWTGTLKLSDNASKGSLMLQTADRAIYIRTVRDFKALVGKEVVVTYSGSLENFTLKNITAK